TPIRGISLVYSFQNLGITSKLNDENITLPFTNNLSIHQSVKISNFDFNNEIKVSQLNENDNPTLAFGSSVNLHSSFSIKGGYKLFSDSESFSGGFSLNIKRLVFDYSYLPFSGDLGNTHILGISYKL
ncbi:MAG: hypothetical protein U9N34_07795, partial [Candidatus Cloacimonadota bacterium]|nr:hypothetical protein [Candidatus Cloacimonadota bacterium]